MRTSQWITEAQRAGWRVASSRTGTIKLACTHQGCKGTLAIPIDNLGPTPAPCDLKHVQQYGAQTFARYESLVQELQRRRRLLGLSQEDINDAAGLADGHIAKLENLTRTAQIPTLQLWADTLGAAITLSPAPIPPATSRAIERRVSAPYDEAKAHHKADRTQGRLFDDR